MATLADSFLDDLDELGESSDEETQEEGAGGDKLAVGGQGDGGENGENGMEVCTVRTHKGAKGQTGRGAKTGSVSVAFTNTVAFASSTGLRCYGYCFGDICNREQKNGLKPRRRRVR